MALKEAIERAQRLQEEGMSVEEAFHLAYCLAEYRNTHEFFEQYDEFDESAEALEVEETYRLQASHAQLAIDELRRELVSPGRLFGNLRDADIGIGTIIDQIYQGTASGQLYYDTCLERAAQLLYMVVKNHLFCDGNKRIATMLFVWYMEANGVDLAGAATNWRSAVLTPRAVFAFTIFIAQSNPKDKDKFVDIVKRLVQFHIYRRAQVVEEEKNQHPTD